MRRKRGFRLIFFCLSQEPSLLICSSKIIAETCSVLYRSWFLKKIKLQLFFDPTFSMPSILNTQAISERAKGCYWVDGWRGAGAGAGRRDFHYNFLGRIPVSPLKMDEIRCVCFRRKSFPRPHYSFPSHSCESFFAPSRDDYCSANEWRVN